jgi:hypothetical protein
METLQGIEADISLFRVKDSYIVENSFTSKSHYIHCQLPGTALLYAQGL